VPGYRFVALAIVGFGLRAFFAAAPLRGQSVSPHADAFTNPANATEQYGFYVYNNHSVQAMFYISCYVPPWGGGLKSCSSDSSTVTLGAGQSAQVRVVYTTGAPQIGQLQFSAYWPDSAQGDTGRITITVQDQTPPTSSSISINPAPHNGDYRDVTKCVADCFDATVSYTTPPYFSLDAPRSATFLYRSSQAKPMGVVQVDATDNTNPAPDKMSILLKRPDGTWVTFTNGSQELFFKDSVLGTSRLSAQFDASALGTGAYNYTVVARSWRSGSFQEATYPIRVLIANEQASRFGAGWSIPSLQTLYPQGDGSVVITEGDGSIAFFKINVCPSTCSFYSPAGDFTTLTTTDGWPGIGGWDRAYPDGTIASFNGQGQLVSVRDRMGRATSYSYSSYPGPLVGITDPAGKKDTLAYNASNKLTWIRDPGGRVDSVTVDASGNLTRIRDAVGGLPFQGTYDAAHRLVGRTDRRGGMWGVAYDFASKLAGDTAPQVTANGQPLRPAVGYASLEKAVLIDPGSGLGSSTNPAPRINGVAIRASVTSPRRITTSYALDRFGAATRLEEPLGRTTAFLRDADSHVVRDSLPSRHITRYSWSRSNLTQVWDSATQRKVNYTHDGTYNLLTMMSGDVDSLINVLTSDRKATDSSRVGGATVWQRFTEVPPFCTQSDQPTAHAVTCAYPHADGFQNTDSVVSYGQPTTPRAKTAYQYDGHGQRVRTISVVGDTTWTQYDSLGRVKRIIGSLHDTTSYTSDSLYLTQVRDANGQIYQVWPNAVGWQDSTADPAGRVTRFTYDSAGNLVKVVNRRGQTIAFTYDSLDQLRFRIVGTDTTKHFADPLGRYIAVANRESVDTLKADSTGRPIVEITCRVLVVGTAAQCFRDSSVYEIRDLRTKLMVTAPGLWSTRTATYHYNPNMLLDSLTNFAGEKQTFTYGGELRDSTRTFLALNNLTLTYGHPPWVQGTSALTFSDPTYNSLVGSAYSYDTLSRVTKHYHGTLATPDTVRSLVDSAGRLVRFADTTYTWSSAACSLGILGESCDYARVQSKAAVGTPAAFYYDFIGNRKDSPTQGYVDPGNRLRRLGYVRMDYDLDGNLTRKRILKASDTTKVLRTDSLFWSVTGQLDSLHSADSLGNQILRIGWGYDGLGRQVRQSLPGNTARFLWDGDNLTFKLDTLGSLVSFWTFYPGTREPQSVTTAGSPFQTFYHVTDAVHNTVGLVRSNPYQLYNQFRYGPFGDSLALTGPTATTGDLRWKGAFYDGYTRYYRMGVRYYDPDVGRFISEDPAGLAAGINPYTFAGNDPVNGYDPSGKFCILCVVIFVGELFVASEVNKLLSHDLQGPGPCDHPPPIRCGGQECTAFGYGGGDCPRAGSGGAIETVGVGLGFMVLRAVYRWLTGAGQTGFGPDPEPPSCRAVTYYGTTGYIGVQTNPGGFVTWGAYMYDPLLNYGDWWAESFINGLSTNEVKKPPQQFYPPHGRVNPSRAKSGDIFHVDVRHNDLFGGQHWSGPNACVVP